MSGDALPSGTESVKELAPGTRIEVYWEVEQEEDGQVKALWWGATVGATKVEDGKNVTVLNYDANAGFDPSEEKVVFMRDYKLQDLDMKEDENRGILNWRLEGAEEDGDKVVTMKDVLDAQTELDQEAGMSAVDLGMSAWAELPYEKQMAMAQTYRAFAEHVKHRLAKLKEEHGKGYEVSQNDVDAIFQELGTKPPPTQIGRRM